MNRDSIRVLHFADAHIDMANYGRHDPDARLPIRVVDFLNALDQIINKAVDEHVDLVIFAGDAYKDRNPHPTFQRAWGQRIMRLSKARIPTVLLVGNHDMSPAAGRAHTLHEFATLDVPYVHVADSMALLGPDELGIPIQMITVPWLSRSRLLRREVMLDLSLQELDDQIGDRVTGAVQQMIAAADPELPLVLVAHVSVEGAKYGSERAVMLGSELVLSPALVRNKRLDYVALGHIHKHQELNDGLHPPIVYPGSIERIDFGEINEQKGYVIADIARERTEWTFFPLDTRRFLNFRIQPHAAETFMQDVRQQLPDAEKVSEAICRVQLTYPREWESLIDEVEIAQRFESALSFQLQKHRLDENRSRLGELTAVESMSPLELLDTYWKTIALPADQVDDLQTLARSILEMPSDNDG